MARLGSRHDEAHVCDEPCWPARRTVRPGRRRGAAGGLRRPGARPRRPRPAGGLRHQRPPRHVAQDVVQRAPHPRHDPGDLRLPARAGLRRAAVHRPRHPRAVRAGVACRRSRCCSPTTSRCWSTAATGSRRPRRSRTRSCAPTCGASRRGPGSPTASSSRPSHNPPSDGGFKYNPPHGGPGRHRRHVGDRGPGQRADPRRARRREAGRRRVGRRALRLPRGVRRRPAGRARPRRGPRGGRPDRRRPARRGQRRLLGRDRRAAPARPDRGQPRGRPDLALHDPRLGREDPDGLLLALRHGVADRPQGRLRRRDRQRRRRRPARHRHARRAG